MAAYIIVEVDVHDAGTFARYREMVPDTLEAFGGRYLVRGGACLGLEGDWAPPRVVVLEFPSLERARAWWESDTYAEAKALRQSCSSARMIAVEGVPP
jgi:uncharacterized protein (DUF1330 family)